MKKKKIAIAVYAIIITVAAIYVYIKSYNRTYNGAFERTYEEYRAILTDNLDDFEYVAKIMQQWDEGSISFYDSNLKLLDFEDALIKNKEIESEISNNEEFYKSLHNLYDLGEVRRIEIKEDAIMFYDSKPTEGYHDCGIAYGENINWNGASQMIENWVSYSSPNI